MIFSQKQNLKQNKLGIITEKFSLKPSGTIISQLNILND
ncbi:hypothetical protein CLV48_11267 [Cecembia rubra]|uniref:Uncharacterized protein n=1 Tax=Cecembia rubra TaxID=1485585 RepID=A0A2P8DWZ6_9BACT|nr:hypothetical protein CLV48_11267 [Cecembia rubra]